MIKRLPQPQLIFDPPNPIIVIREQAVLECGCWVGVGLRADREVSTMAAPCAPAHAALMRHFDLLLRESTVEPRDEDLVVVCEELLYEAARHFSGS